jgi:hypothetical protein
MTDKNHEQTNPDWQDAGSFRASESVELDRALDAALAKYAAVEPRPGLEERVLAHLRSAPAPRRWMTWKLWTAAGLAVAAIVVTAGLAMIWRAGRNSHPVIANHPSAPAQRQAQPETQIAANQQSGAQSRNSEPAAKISPRRNRPQPEVAVAAKVPRLEQFPSPQPLSDQEKILATYIAKYPRNAALLAEARTVELRQEAEEHRRLASEDSQQ